MLIFVRCKRKVNTATEGRLNQHEIHNVFTGCCFTGDHLFYLGVHAATDLFHDCGEISYF